MFAAHELTIRLCTFELLSGPVFLKGQLIKKKKNYNKERRHTCAYFSFFFLLHLTQRCVKTPSFMTCVALHCFYHFSYFSVWSCGPPLEHSSWFQKIPLKMPWLVAQSAPPAASPPHTPSQTHTWWLEVVLLGEVRHAYSLTCVFEPSLEIGEVMKFSHFRRERQSSC